MNNCKLKYYEQSCLWEADFSHIPGESERIEESVRAIPKDVSTVLDVGCGNGGFINGLLAAYANKFDKIVGVDLSNQALRHVIGTKVNSSVANLSFKSKSFDLVSCLEVLEHLGQEEFSGTISEIQRVSKKYILISVPNEEILERELVLCPKCCCAFNPFFHVRSFSERKLSCLFNRFKPVKIREVGPCERFSVYNSLIYFLRLAYRKPFPPVTSICPQCGYQMKQELKNVTPLSVVPPYYQRLFSILKKSIPRKRIERKRWFLALYSRCDE